MTHRTTVIDFDSFWDAYQSAEIDLDFDSQMRSPPQSLDKDIKTAVAAWAIQRKTDWAKQASIEDESKQVVAFVIGSRDATAAPRKPFYLYLGFSAEEKSFAIHVRFRRLENLDDIERMLRSIKLKGK